MSEKHFTFVKSNKKRSIRPVFQESDSMKDRIRQVMEAQHMTQQTFASFIGMSAASLSSIFNNRTKPTIKTVEAIKSKIPNLSTDWLVFGRGDMYDDEQPSASSTPSQVPSAVMEPALDFSSGGSNDLFSQTNEPKQPAAAPRQQVSIRRPQPVQAIKPEIRYVERPQRQITEIRVFFDDGTYESFSPKK